ncbi:MAG: ATP-binding protein, partial [Bacillota bacterium]
YLLWPGQFSTDRINIEGNFKFNGSNWYVELDAGRVLYQQDGTKVSPPGFFPPPEHRDRYLISLHDLIQEGNNDTSLAEIILSESTGGFRIEDIVQERNLKDKPSQKGKNTRNAQKMIRKYKMALKKQKQLKTEENKLESLYRKKHNIKKSRKKLEVVNHAADYLHTKNELKKLEDRLEKFPENISLVEGDEYEKIKKLNSNITGVKNKLNILKDKLKENRKLLFELDLKRKSLDYKFIIKLKNKRDNLKSAEKDIADMEDNLKQAEFKMKEERKHFLNFLENKNLEKLKKIKGTAYNELSTFARKAEKIQNKIDSFTCLENLLKPKTEIPEKEREVKNGIRYLEEWLQLPAPSHIVENKLKKITTVSTAVISLISVILSFTLNPLYLLLLLVSSGIIWYAGKGTQTDNYRKKAEKDFAQLTLESPSTWEKQNVRDKLEQLYELAVEIKLIKRHQQYWQDREKEYKKILKEKDKLEKRKKELINKYGLVPDTGENTIYYFTNRLSRWQDAYLELESLKSKLKNKQQRYKGIRRDLNNLLKQYGYNNSQESTEISANINDLEKRLREYQRVKENKYNLEKQIEQLENNLDKYKKSKIQIYENLNLKPGADNEVKKLCNVFSDYSKVKSKYDNLNFAWKRERTKLEQLPEFEESFLEQSLPELKEKKRELREKVDKYEKIQKNINEIETRIATAREGQSVEKALAAKERALDKLNRDLKNDYEKVAGKVLLDYVREVNKISNRPAVFKKAQKIFRRITRGKYKLEISNSKSPAFKAIDTISGKGKSLQQLSSGTRIQLLFSVRMAFVVIQEKGINLPLYLDETLANADDQRAEAIIRSVLEIVSEGRQCFYFTAQKDEVKKWLSILKADPFRSRINYKLIKLNQKSRQNNSTFSIDTEKIIPEIEYIPDASNLSHTEYGEELSVPDFNPYQGAESLHLWYIIEEVELLEKLLKMGIERWGQLKLLLKKNDYEFIAKNKKMDLIKDTGYCIEEFVESWKTGRGKPVDRLVLKESGAVSDNFIDEVTELAEKVEGRGKVLIQKLRKGAVSNFLTRKINELEEYFIKEGYIDTSDILNEEEIYIRMLSVISGGELVKIKN